MASPLQDQLFYRDRVSSGFINSTQIRPRGSKCQISLHKILRIITTVPPLPPTGSPRFSASDTKESTADDDSNNRNKRSGLDLNIGFCASSETVEFLRPNSAGSAVLGGGAPRIVNLDGGGDPADKKDSGNGVSENGSSDIKIEETGDSLTLLVEAAKLIFGNFEENDKSESEPGNQNVSRIFELKKDNEEAKDINPPKERQLRRRSNWLTAAEMVGEFNEPPSSPVVRSKRGRTQVLPCKYRDSVMEPLTQFSRNRSSILPSKRRRR